MGIFSALSNAASAMSVFGQSLNVIENNISNSSTPGYAEQEQSLVAAPFEPTTGLTGGVLAGPLISSRSEYLEQSVRSQTELLGSAEQQASDLGQIQPLFSLTSTSGVDSSLNTFFNSFSQLGVNPNDATDRQAVINSAQQVAGSINSTAAGINQVLSNVSTQTGDVVANINQITGQITEINQVIQSDAGASQDAGLDAQMHTALESLSELTNYTVIKAGDGTDSVYIGGQTPLVLGNTQFRISAEANSPQTVILDSQGNDITSQISQGQLGALIGEKNTTLPGYMTSLNTLASSLSDTVNGQLFQGVDQNGTAGAPLFNYDQVSDAAESLAVTSITTDQIAAASPSAPNGNANAIALANLATTPAANGFTFTQMYANLGTQVGNDVATATQNQTQYQNQVTQAQAQRSSQEGVSLNAEAAKLLQFQQAYAAVGKLISVLDGLTEDVINIVVPTA
ncbi:MAG: flagellar hook-associated protein FlgK [Bryobacteraceae bacterium]|jgi:flagellar hook-associated protein 1 FlgK